MTNHQKQTQFTIKLQTELDPELNKIVKTEQFSQKYQSNSSQTTNLQTQNSKSSFLAENSIQQYTNIYTPYIYQNNTDYVDQQLQKVITNMYIALENQSKLLHKLALKSQQNVQKTSKIYNQFMQYRKQQNQDYENQIKPSLQKIMGDDITAADLIRILYDPKPNFKYSLVLDPNHPLDKILYRERNFKLKLNLVDSNGYLYPNTNRIPISLALYTVQNPPKFLQSNTLGNKMIKGHTQQDLLNGQCLFQKIQIKQVTSHYKKGMLFLVAFAKMPSFGTIIDNKYVEYTTIRPLVIDKLVVKAKKLKQQHLSKEEKDMCKQKEDDNMKYRND